MSLVCTAHAAGTDRRRSVFGTEVATWDDLAVHRASPPDGDAWRAAKQAELECFAVPNGWATAESIAAGEVVDYAPFEERSEIFTVVAGDAPDHALAAARMIWAAEGLPLTEQFLVSGAHRFDDQWTWFLHLVGLDRVSEWATLGSRTPNGQPMFALIAAMFRAARVRGIDYWIQSVTLPLLHGYQQGLRIPILQIGEPEIVVGAVSVPTIIFLDEGSSGAMLSWDPDLKRRIFGPWSSRRTVPELERHTGGR